jgi:hypothetical protein
MTWGDLRKFLDESGCKLSLVSIRKKFLAAVSRQSFVIGLCESSDVEMAITEAIAEARKATN